MYHVVGVLCFVYYVTVFVYLVLCFFFFKQKTAYEMRISDWSSDVCSSDLPLGVRDHDLLAGFRVEVVVAVDAVNRRRHAGDAGRVVGVRGGRHRGQRGADIAGLLEGPHRREGAVGGPPLHAYGRACGRERVCPCW